jgi:hypothetical protein
VLAGSWGVFEGSLEWRIVRYECYFKPGCLFLLFCLDVEGMHTDSECECFFGPSSRELYESCLSLRDWRVPRLRDTSAELLRLLTVSFGPEVLGLRDLFTTRMFFFKFEVNETLGDGID